MKKRCTNPACRRLFSLNAAKEEGTFCPYCGKAYPRVKPGERGYWDVILDMDKDYVRMVKAIREIRFLTGMSLSDSKAFFDAGKQLVLGTYQNPGLAKKRAAAELARLEEQMIDPYPLEVVRHIYH